MQKTGGCLCGAVIFTANDVPSTAGICHCPMCRRWTGSALIGVTVPKDKVVWQGEHNISRLQSSRWAERAWCSQCGSNMYFRVTMDSDWSGNIELPLGLFDDPNGFEITNEIYIDHKPDSYAFAGEDTRKQLTRDECVAKFPVLNEDGPIKAG